MECREAYFFPNKAPDVMELEHRLRCIAQDLAEAERFALYEVLTAAHPDLPTTRFEPEQGFVRVVQAGGEIFFPRPLPLIKFAHVSCGYEEWLARKYELPGFVSVDESDVVVDCGAYVGGFSISAARKAAAVHLFEPAPENFACSSRNIAHVENVIINQMGLYFRTESIKLNLSSSSVEHSIILPDNGEIVASIDVPVIRLDDYCRQSGIDRIDFLKIEAEGVELEVFEGLGDIPVKKFAIDVSEERNGESPAQEFWLLLRARGYEVRQRGHVLFARLASE